MKIKTQMKIIFKVWKVFNSYEIKLAQKEFQFEK